MKKIDSFEQLRAAVEGAEYKADKPFKALVAIVLIIMVQLRKSYSPEVEERYAFATSRTRRRFPSSATRPWTPYR